jgi:alpha-beta hydrolase superfamily lysophospholipase
MVMSAMMSAWLQEVVILCHGLGDHKDGFHLPAMARALGQRGLGSLRIDFPGCGESEGVFKYANMRDEVATLCDILYAPGRHCRANTCHLAFCVKAYVESM